MKEEMDYLNLDELSQDDKSQNKQQKSFLKKLKRVLTAIGVIAILMLIALVVLCVKKPSIIEFAFNRNSTPIASQVADEVIDPPAPIITSDYISSKLELISDLSTAKITYGCMCDLKAGSIPLITQKGFSMYYEATVKAGIDIAQITNKVTDEKVIVKLPPARIQDCKIEANSITFYDVDNALFSKNKPSDVPIALEYAEKDVYYQATTDQLLDVADENAVKLITALLSGYVNDLEIEVVKGERGTVDKVQPPYSSTDVVGLDYKDVFESFEKYGFTNIIENEISDIKIGVFAKEGKVESVKIGDKTSFKKSNIFDADTEVVITYHTKKTK